MNTLVIVIIGYLVLCFIVCALHKIMPLLTFIGWMASSYLFFVMEERTYGILLFALVAVLATFAKIYNEIQQQEGSKGKKEFARNERRTSRRVSNSSMNKMLMYLIPIFWPYLIIKSILSEKQAKIDMTPYDYEQHLKSNGNSPRI